MSPTQHEPASPPAPAPAPAPALALAPAPPATARSGSAPQPQVGVGILVVQDGLLLLGRRLGAHGAGSWSAPGGRLEFAEALEDCAQRELLEETGLRASSIELGPYCSDVFPEVPAHFLTVFVVARGLTGAPQNREPDKCEGWAWFRWDGLPVPLFKPLQSLRAIGWRPGGL